MIPRRSLTFAVAGVWSFAGLAKLIDSVPPSDFAAQPNGATYVGLFPWSAVVTLAVVEVALGIWQTMSTRRAALLAGLGLLGVLAVVLVVVPPTPGQTCGCIGAANLPGSPETRIGAFAGMHALAMLVARMRR